VAEEVLCDARVGSSGDALGVCVTQVVWGDVRHDLSPRNDRITNWRSA
jgi:hypothetical protein